jgi:hypothetical protein
MAVLVGTLAFVGGLVVGKVIWDVMRELIRAARQAMRIAHVVARANGRREKPSFGLWWSAFRHDFTSSYDSLVIRYVEMPRNPSRPMRARLPR